ncbi:MAG: hypothetical protein R6U89_06895, partial [Dehalococcoidia bacterium]
PTPAVETTDWYAAEYDLLMPVKSINHTTYKDEEVRELKSYDPMPEKAHEAPEPTSKPEPTETPECNTYYWFDDTTDECGEKEFCGTYMYEGLQTFETLEECEEALADQETPEPTGTPGSTETPEPTVTPIIGTSWVYEVTYEDDEKNEYNTVDMNASVTGEEVLDGMDTYVVETEMQGTAKRWYYYPDMDLSVPVELFSSINNRSLANHEMQMEAFSLYADFMGGLDIDVAREYDHTNRPVELSDGASWTYDTIIELPTFDFYEELTWDAEVVGIEEIEVPAGTYNCYHVQSSAAGSTNHFWWDVEGELLCPVKYTYNHVFIGNQTCALKSYTSAE